MIKKLGIAVACGAAIFGIAKLFNRYVVVVVQSPSLDLGSDTSNSMLLDDAPTIDTVVQTSSQESDPTVTTQGGSTNDSSCADKAQDESQPSTVLMHVPPCL